MKELTDMSEQGILVVVSGFSGAGKGTLIKAMLEKHHNYALSISATTRAPRQGEEDGREYFFVTREKFEEMIREGQLIEYARYVENYYGTPRQYVFQQMADGKDVILEIEIQGALKIKERFPAGGQGHGDHGGYRPAPPQGRGGGGRDDFL